MKLAFSAFLEEGRLELVLSLGSLIVPIAPIISFDGLNMSYVEVTF